MTTEKTFLEFFAGIGLVHYGLQRAGWRCVYANDICAKKQAMYLDEFPDASYFHREDIWQTDRILAQINAPATLATASFPCIDLSLAGYRKGLQGEHSSTLFGFLAVMKRLQERHQMPPLVMLENVTGLLTGNQGKDFEETCQAVAELGFYLDAFILDAKHFTPQSRPRLFLVGVAKSLLPSTLPLRANPLWHARLKQRQATSSAKLYEALRTIKLPTGWIAFDLPPLPPEQRQLASVIDFDAAQEWWSEEEVRKHFDRMSDLHRRRVEALLQSKQRWVGAMFRRIRTGTTRSEVRFDGLAGCLRTAKGGSGKQIVVVIEAGRLRMRWMTPVEYARLQGVPDFNIRRPRIQALTGFADAVCVPAIEWIAEHILNPLVSGVDKRATYTEQSRLPFAA
jgi:DNA (cytosine-5)-methyltransferase 1